MSVTSTETPVELILSRLAGVKKSGAGWICRCPAHEDRTPSLKVDVGQQDEALLFCHAGCTAEAIVAALGLGLADLYAAAVPTAHQNGQSRRIVATYPYEDADGRLLYEVLRYEPKTFRQRRPDGAGSWVWDLRGVERVLYRLPELLAADPSETVFVVEGERDVDRLRALGCVATCNVGGAGKWRPVYTDALAGRDVVILPDNDEPGQRHAEHVAASLAGIAASIKVVTL